jgi:hypothetical protein
MPIIHLAFRGCTNRGFMPAASISRTIQYQWPMASYTAETLFEQFFVRFSKKIAIFDHFDHI